MWWLCVKCEAQLRTYVLWAGTFHFLANQIRACGKLGLVWANYSERLLKKNRSLSEDRNHVLVFETFFSQRGSLTLNTVHEFQSLRLSGLRPGSNYSSGESKSSLAETLDPSESAKCVWGFPAIWVGPYTRFLSLSHENENLQRWHTLGFHIFNWFIVRIKVYAICHWRKMICYNN